MSRISSVTSCKPRRRLARPPPTRRVRTGGSVRPRPTPARRSRAPNTSPSQRHEALASRARPAQRDRELELRGVDRRASTEGREGRQVGRIDVAGGGEDLQQVVRVGGGIAAADRDHDAAPGGSGLEGPQVRRHENARDGRRTRAKRSDLAVLLAHADTDVTGHLAHVPAVHDEHGRAAGDGHHLGQQRRPGARSATARRAAPGSRDSSRADCGRLLALMIALAPSALASSRVSFRGPQVVHLVLPGNAQVVTTPAVRREQKDAAPTRARR